MLHERIRRLATAVTVAVVAILLVPGLVLGHADLVTATPADKSVATQAVVEVSGLYSEAMKPDGSSLVVKDASGTQVAKGGVDPQNTQRMVATPTAALGDGAYTVESTTLAEDGDIERATWTFTVAIAASATATAVSSAAASAASSAVPTAVPATSAATVAPAPSPSGDGATTGSGSDVVLPIIVALIALGAGAGYLLTRRNRPTDQA